MAMSQQSFPQITARFLQSLEDKEEFQGMAEGVNLADKKILSGNYEHMPCLIDIICISVAFL